MRLLVVDDEKVVQNSIALIIKKENLKFVEMETASTGKEAIEKALSFHPDVVFMDINMPGLNGIDAMKSISRLYPSILFVVVTAYDVFEYAKESLRVGACDYIVKPFVPKRIVEVLVSLNEKVMRRAAEHEEILQLREKVSELSEFANDGALELMISNRDVEMLLNRYENIIPKHGGRIALLYVDEAHLIKAEAVLMEIRNGFSGVICGSFIKKRSILFVPRGLDLKVIERKLKDNLGENGFLLACGSEEDIQNIRVSYRHAVSVLCNAEKACGLIEFTESSELQDIGELYVKVAQCDSSMLQFALEELLSCVSDSEDFAENVNKMAIALLVTAQVILGGDIVNAQLAEVAAAGFENVLNSANEQELIETSVDFLVNIRQSAFNQNENRYVQAALEYIEQNYAKDISLEMTARHISISSSTLSRLFRTELEKSFTELLIEKRISKACMMIKEGRLSIKEICFKVGYNDPNYFSRVFKKTTGLSPSDYREYGI